MVHFGLLQTHPFFVESGTDYDEYGYPLNSESVLEFEGLIDHVGGNRRNDYMTINADTTHVIIAGFSEELYNLLDESNDCYLKDGADNEYKVLLVDDPGRQAHHLEIEVEIMQRPVGDVNDG